MVTRSEEVTIIRLVEGSIKRVVHQIRDGLLTKGIKEVVVQVEEEAMEENPIKVIFNAIIVKSMAIMKVNV